MRIRLFKIISIVVIFIFPLIGVFAQDIRWTPDGNGFYMVDRNEIIQVQLPGNKPETLVSKEMLTPAGQKTLSIRDFQFSEDQSKVQIFTNTKKVWRLNTEGDYWVLDLKTKKLQQAGKSRPASSMRFAKLSPDGSQMAYVSEYNIYVEDLKTGKETALTTGGNRRMIYGTFDWVYEEEFACRDGFQWSPDGKHIAFWQVNAGTTRDYYMINNTDSVYSKIIPVEYPTVGQPPSAVKIGVVELASGKTNWMKIPGEPTEHYLPRMEWNSNTELFIQQLNRKQNTSIVFNGNIASGEVKEVLKETDEDWIDVMCVWENVYALTFRHQFQWINQQKEFIWFSEKDGWRHVYRVTKEGKMTQVTKGNFDVMNLLMVDEKTNLVYFLASPDNATQKYLYKTTLDGKGIPQRVTPEDMPGSHEYDISPFGKFAQHIYQNSYTQPAYEMLSLPNNKPLFPDASIANQLAKGAKKEQKVEFFKVKTNDGVEMDGWMVKPENFDPAKKYPVLFYVYTEPWGAEVKDRFGIANNRLYRGDLAKDGYLYVCVDNRGTPSPKGREWRKSIYRKIGQLNIADQAAAATEILKWPFVDTSRVAVWGWSGGGSATLNLMFQHPEIYKTGIAIAAVGNQLTYDNIYQERYMGLPQENMEDFVKGSPITYAKNLKGNLLYIHGTGDDNVHYNNAEMLINELIKHNKIFGLMLYPNRSHSISEGEGTFRHLSSLYTQYLTEHCPPGGR